MEEEASEDISDAFFFLLLTKGKVRYSHVIKEKVLMDFGCNIHHCCHNRDLCQPLNRWTDR